MLKGKLELDDSLLNKIIEIYIIHEKIDLILELYYRHLDEVEESIGYLGISRFHKLLPRQLQKRIISTIREIIIEEEDDIDDYDTYLGYKTEDTPSEQILDILEEVE